MDTINFVVFVMEPAGVTACVDPPSESFPMERA